MTEEYPGAVPGFAGQQLTQDQAAQLAAQQAAQTASSPSPAGEQAAAAAQMAGGERGPLLPAEAAMDALMAQLKAQSEQIQQLAGQVGVMQRQAEEAQAAAGGPLVVRYAQGAADKLAALEAARPDHAAGHFEGVRATADRIVTAARELARGTGVPSEAAAAVQAGVSEVEKFISRGHARAGGAHLDWSAILDDLGLVAEEAVKLAA